MSEAEPRTQRFTLHYNEPLLRRAVKAFVGRVAGWKFFVGVTLIIAALSRLVVHGGRGWFNVLLMAALVIAVGGVAAVYVLHLRSTLGRFRAMKTPESLFEFDEQRVRFISDSGVLETPWPGIKEVWRFPEFWLLFLTPAQFVTVPTADIPEDAREQIAARVRANGGKVS